jgi:hypothetical protein
MDAWSQDGMAYNFYLGSPPCAGYIPITSFSWYHIKKNVKKIILIDVLGDMDGNSMGVCGLN